MKGVKEKEKKKKKSNKCPSIGDRSNCISQFGRSSEFAMNTHNLDLITTVQ